MVSRGIYPIPHEAKGVTGVPTEKATPPGPKRNGPLDTCSCRERPTATQLQLLRGVNSILYSESLGHSMSRSRTGRAANLPPMTASFRTQSLGIFTPLRLITITFASQNSSDSDVGRRPEFKSDETCDANVIVIEITSHLCLKPLKQVVQLLVAQPTHTTHIHLFL